MGLILLALLGMVACHEGGPVDPRDAPRTPWPAEPVPCDRTGFEPVWERVVWQPAEDGAEGVGFLRYEARDSLTEPFNVLLIESYADAAYNGPNAPGRYVLDGANYADCGLCIRIRTGCYGSWCTGQYYAGQGALDIDTLAPPGGNLVADLMSLGLRETSIDPSTAISTTTADSPGWCLPEFSIDLPVEEPGADTQCSSLGTGISLGEGIADFTLTNCLGEPVKLHDTCGKPGAVWFIATAGWCEACKAWLPVAVEEWGRRIDDGLELMVVLGEDANGRAPTVDYCNAYAEANGVPPDRLFIDHGVLSSWQTLFSNVSPYALAGIVTLPWNAVLDGQNMEYLWTDAADDRTVYEVLDTTLGKR